MKAHPLRRTVLTCAATVTVTVLALAMKPHGTTASAAPPVTAPSDGSSGSSSDGSSGSATGGSSGGSTATTRTVTGDTVQTRYGPVQVELTLSGSKITAARAVQTPANEPRSRQINASAVPTLIQETLDAQSARIDTVSGATFTSEGYISSLQSALDQTGG
ncbi:FMN-binding protein [Streptomyces sp. NPDC059639]|uniref:FMN-binding protein n=1 Tax=Streptomyces sp. NPDC059639 TaxID=3346891 RepID=UPI00367E81E4